MAGAAQAAAGVLGIAGSTGLCSSGIGCALGEVTGSVSTDYAWAGAKQAVTGTAAQAYGEQVLQSLGLSPQTAAYTYAYLGLTPAIGEVALAGAVRNGLSSSGRMAAVSSAGEVAVGANSLNVSATVAAARIRQSTMLQDNVGFNISPTAWDAYPTIGRNGTFVSDKQGVMNYFGDLDGKTEVIISSALATKIEKDIGLVPGTLQDGFKIRQVTGVQNMQPLSPMEGNQYFQGAGNHLPGGAPEMVINSIPTVDNSVVNTILKVKVGK